MRSLTTTAALFSAVLFAVAPFAEAGSRVMVSATLNSTIQVFDSETFAELQPPLGSRGGGPVRLWVQKIDGKDYLFTANHGVVSGSLGIFDLSLPIVTELPLSPFPARAGSVGVVAGDVDFGGGSVPMAFVTNSYFALAPCTLGVASTPSGSVTGYDLSLLSTAGLAQVVGTVGVSGAVPYAVSIDGTSGRAFVSVSCAGTLDTIQVTQGELIPHSVPVAERFTMANVATRPVGAGPDATLFAGGRSYTNNISGGSITVYDATSPAPLTTVPLKKANGSSVGPIDANLADTPGGRHLIVTSNGSDDSVSLIDRDLIEGCIQASAADCPAAEVLRVHTAVAGGAPEGIDYDPATNRIFTVNKNILNPSLSVIQLTEGAGGSITGVDIHQIPIVAVDANVPAPNPALIAFDVVVQK